MNETGGSYSVSGSHDTDGCRFNSQGQSVSDGHKNLMNSIARAPLKRYEPKLTQLLATVGTRTDNV